MSDLNFMREIEEEVRRDQMLKLWQRYGNYLIGLAVLIVLVCVIQWAGDRLVARLDHKG